MDKINVKEMKDRLKILSIILASIVVITFIITPFKNNQNIQKTDVSICLNETTEEIFETQFEKTKKLYKYYNYSVSTDSKTSDLIFTSDISQVNTSQKYSVEGYSPLVICLKDTKNLNNYLTAITKQGFLTCSNSKKIKNSSSDEVFCDFARIIDTVIDGGDWSNLGGEDKKITIYCPEPNTIESKLFYDFLLITINNGKYPTDNLEEVKKKADLFLNSSNTIQTDVCSKISKLGGILQEEDIYILFESDLISATKGDGDICVTYPETTVIKQLYLQYNNLDKFSESLFNSYTLNSQYYYRTEKYSNFISSDSGYSRYFNLQEGFNHYELTY